MVLLGAEVTYVVPSTKTTISGIPNRFRSTVGNLSNSPHSPSMIGPASKLSNIDTRMVRYTQFWWLFSNAFPRACRIKDPYRHGHECREDQRKEGFLYAFAHVT